VHVPEQHVKRSARPKISDTLVSIAAESLELASVKIVERLEKLMADVIPVVATIKITVATRISTRVNPVSAEPADKTSVGLGFLCKIILKT
jgi:hypothetical protein